MGSFVVPQQLPDPHEEADPPATRSAAFPYRSRTDAFTSSWLIGSSPNQVFLINRSKKYPVSSSRSSAPEQWVVLPAPQAGLPSPRASLDSLCSTSSGP